MASLSTFSAHIQSKKRWDLKETSDSDFWMKKDFYSTGDKNIFTKSVKKALASIDETIRKSKAKDELKKSDWENFKVRATL